MSPPREGSCTSHRSSRVTSTPAGNAARKLSATARDRDILLPGMKPGEYAIINRDWRYIRYADGSEELYDMQQDPREWHNLAASPAHAAVLARHRQLAPAQSRQPVPGSRDRILLYDPVSGRLNWEGTDIPPGAPIPELED